MAHDQTDEKRIEQDQCHLISNWACTLRWIMGVGAFGLWAHGLVYKQVQIDLGSAFKSWTSFLSR